MILNKTTFIRFYYILIFSLFVFNLYSQNENLIKTVEIYSQSMQKSHKAIIYLPDSYYVKQDSFPVVYLLHGYSGHFDDWFKRDSNILSYSHKYNTIIVTPEGNFDSWYIDSPIKSEIKYETYISTEVPQWIDTHFKTISDKKHRAITGLSMGGHGALCIAADHPDIFGAAGSMSGVLDLRTFHEKWNLQEILGDLNTKPSYWFVNSFAGKLYKIDRKEHSQFIIDCGKSDVFFDVNEKVHKLLKDNHINHKFIISEGDHNWDYWKKMLPMHLEFFRDYFNTK